MSTNRRLAAIAVADVVGYSRLMEADEAGTLAALKQRRVEILEPMVRVHGGRIVKLMGDGVLLEFASAVNAVKAALELQTKFAEANQPLPAPRRIVLRIGINLGDVIGEGSDIFGDGVNIAARLEGLAEPGGICISAKVYDEVCGKIDVTFTDLGDKQLKNITSPVRAFAARTGVVPMELSPTPSAKLSIAVLPLDNMSGDPSQQYLSDGITEDIITELSRFRNLSVASRHASFHLGGKGVNPVQAARDLGVNFVVEGSLRKTSDRLRITVQLIDAKTGNHIWAERYDRQSADIFAVQDEVVSAIVATLEGRIMAAGAVLTHKKPTASWTAYDYLLQGRELANAHREAEAVPLFSRATAIDPNFAEARAWLVIGLMGTYWGNPDPNTLDLAADAAQRALELDSNDSMVHHANAMVMLWLRRYEGSATHFDRAIALNPVDPETRADRAILLNFTGRSEEALSVIDDALRRSPFPPAWFWQIRGLILLHLKRYAEVVNALNSVPHKNIFSYFLLAAALSYLGHGEKAAQALARARELRPELSSRDVAALYPYEENAGLDHLLDGLRKAGLPE